MAITVYVLLIHCVVYVLARCIDNICISCRFLTELYTMVYKVGAEEHPPRVHCDVSLTATSLITGIVIAELPALALGGA